MRKLLLIFFLAALSLYGQDSTISQVFRHNAPKKGPVFRAKYPSYSLLAGYLLVTEANKNDPFAQHELGIRYLIGQGFPADTAKAIYWIRKAVDKNLPSALYNYGIMLHNGIGVPWNPFEAYENFKAASDAGLPEAQFAYALLLTDNLTTNRDLAKAYGLLNSAAKADYQPAKEILEQLKKSGFIPPQDSASQVDQKRIVDETASLINPNWDLDFYEFEKEESDLNADNQLEKLLSKKGDELKKFFGLEESKNKLQIEDTTGLGILKFAAENGSPEAISTMARAYEKGYFFEKNLVTAASYYLRAYRLGSLKSGERLFGLIQDEGFVNKLKEKINKGDADAMYVWAGITALGFGSQISINQALDFLKSAVSKKHIPSMIELGILYNSGTLVEKSKERAYNYWNMAANLGSREASIRIAFASIADSSDNSDKSGKVKFLQSASEEGSVLAQTFLAFCYEKGLVVKENKGMAAVHYRRAAQRGNQSAFNSLKRMYDEIRPPEEEYQIFSED